MCSAWLIIARSVRACLDPLSKVMCACASGLFHATRSHAHALIDTRLCPYSFSAFAPTRSHAHALTLDFVPLVLSFLPLLDIMRHFVLNRSTFLYLVMLNVASPTSHVECCKFTVLEVPSKQVLSHEMFGVALAESCHVWCCPY